MGLFASFPVDEVTVLDIAGAVGMTPAAVYYHFASKEQILLEGMQQFSHDLIAQVRLHSPAAGDRGGVGELLASLMAWIRRHRAFGVVYFVNSVGLNQMVEARRRETRLQLVELFGAAARSARRSLTPTQAGVIAVALVSLLETAAASALNQDSIYRSLGARRFTDEVRAMAQRIAGIPS